MFKDIYEVLGNAEIILQVLQWMEDAELQPSITMYRDVLFFAQRSGGSDLAAVIQERIGSLIKSCILYTLIAYLICFILHLTFNRFLET